MDTSHGSTPPQTGRTAPPIGLDAPRSLWSQMLTTVRDMGGVFDPFVNDQHPDVRALGRQALQRRSPNDNFMLGDLCAWLTPQNGVLSSDYALKAITAYARAGEGQTDDAWAARSAMLAFFNWCATTAHQRKRYESLRTAIQVGEQILQLGIVTSRTPEYEQMNRTLLHLREDIAHLMDGQPSQVVPAGDEQSDVRKLLTKGQDLLRRYQPADALDQFEQAVQQGHSSHGLWLWRAMALTDLGRFDDAFASYDRALEAEPDNAGTWNAKGALLLELGRLQEAKHCFDQAMRNDASASTMAQCIYALNRGKALYMLGDYQSALRDLEQSHQLEPTPESAAGIAACKEQLARAEEQRQVAD